MEPRKTRKGDEVAVEKDCGSTRIDVDERGVSGLDAVVFVGFLGTTEETKGTKE